MQVITVFRGSKSFLDRLLLQICLPARMAGKMVLLSAPQGSLYAMVRHLGPARWQLLEFSLSPMRQCRNTCSKSLLHDKCYAEQLRASQGNSHNNKKTKTKTIKEKNQRKVAKMCDYKFRLKSPLQMYSGVCAPTQSKTGQEQSMNTLRSAPTSGGLHF